MTVLWTAEEAAAATGGRAQGVWQASGVAIDTREIELGDLFIALQGDARDGHEFVADALAKGAAAAMVTHVPEDVDPDAPLLLVRDTLDGLVALGRAARARTDARVVAVTGSVGKTSTKEMLRTMRGAEGRTHAAIRSFNNHWGVPLTLARMPEATEFVIIEIGMNHAGEITPLTRLARPHVALITNVEPVHIEHFGSLEAIADAKAEIFLGLEQGGTAVLNAGNAQFDPLAKAAAPHRVVAFGGGAPDFCAESVQVAERCTILRAMIGGQQSAFKIGAPGVHFATNALGALAAVQAVGGDLCRAALALSNWRPPSGRGSREVVSLGPAGIDGSLTLLDESYNANPASMQAALSVLAGSPVIEGQGRVMEGRRIAILGDMLELGPEEAAYHAGLACLPEIDGIDRVHCCGPRMKALHDALPAERRGCWWPDSEALAAGIGKKVDAGDVIMVKGSAGARMARVVEAIRGLGAAASPLADEDA